MAKRGFKKGKFLSTLIVLLCASLAVSAILFFFMRDSSPAVVKIVPGQGPVAKEPLELFVTDPESGLMRVSVFVEQGEKSVEILSRSYDLPLGSLNETFSLVDRGLKNGKIRIRVVTENGALLTGKGDESFEFDYDSKPPNISIMTRTHNIARGGAGLVIYSLSEEVRRSGVAIGDYFFPGYRQETGDYLCFFAYPDNMDSSDFKPLVLAEDLAGNQRKAGFDFYANPKKFRSDRINVSDRFLDSKMHQFSHLYPDAESNLEIFLEVNKKLRVENRATVRQLGLKTSQTPLWKGTFLRQPKAASRGYFADRRTYYYKGKMIDKQRHLGIDLASNAHAPVVASNRGRVIFADFLGIYGQCVILDHGAGLQSIYSHLSQISAEIGDEVAKGDIIANTGATGMAGGDHLHFAVLISGVPVTPLEWWDRKWLANNITSKLEN